MAAAQDKENRKTNYILEVEVDTPSPSGRRRYTVDVLQHPRPSQTRPVPIPVPLPTASAPPVIVTSNQKRKVLTARKSTANPQTSALFRHRILEQERGDTTSTSSSGQQGSQPDDSSSSGLLTAGKTPANASTFWQRLYERDVEQSKSSTTTSSLSTSGHEEIGGPILLARKSTGMPQVSAFRHRDLEDEQSTSLSTSLSGQQLSEESPPPTDPSTTTTTSGYSSIGDDGTAARTRGVVALTKEVVVVNETEDGGTLRQPLEAGLIDQEEGQGSLRQPSSSFVPASVVEAPPPIPRVIPPGLVAILEATEAWGPTRPRQEPPPREDEEEVRPRRCGRGGRYNLRKGRGKRVNFYNEGSN